MASAPAEHSPIVWPSGADCASVVELARRAPGCLDYAHTADTLDLAAARRLDGNAAAGPLAEGGDSIALW